MNLRWSGYINYSLNATTHENYDAAKDPDEAQPLYEIEFKTGSHINANDIRLMLEAERKGENINYRISDHSIKCVEIINF